MLEIALGILHEDPGETNVGAVRGWAVDLMSKYSGVTVDSEAKAELVSKPLTFAPVDLSQGSSSQSGVEREVPKQPQDPATIDRLQSLARDSNTFGWMQYAIGELGTLEVSGSDSNKRIVDYARELGIDYPGDDVFWSGLFVAWVLNQAGYGDFPENVLGNRNWEKWGTPSSEPVFGSLAVFWRVSPTSGLGHVGFVVSTDAERIQVLGGNQGNSVSLAWVAKNRLLSVRLPPGYNPPRNE